MKVIDILRYIIFLPFYTIAYLEDKDTPSLDEH